MFFLSDRLPGGAPAVGSAQWRGGVKLLSADSARLRYSLQQHPPHSTMECIQAHQEGNNDFLLKNLIELLLSLNHSSFCLSTFM